MKPSEKNGIGRLNREFFTKSASPVMSIAVARPLIRYPHTPLEKTVIIEYRIPSRMMSYTESVIPRESSAGSPKLAMSEGTFTLVDIHFYIDKHQYSILIWE